MSKKYILSFSLSIFLTISCTKDQETAAPKNQVEESVESTIKKQPKVIPPETKSPATPKFSIHEAARRGNLEEIKKHINEGNDLNENESIFGSPLHNAIAYGQLETVKLLIDEGADVNQKSPEDGSSTVIRAVFFSYPEILKHLITNGANKDVTDNKGMSPLNLLQIPWQEMTGIYKFVESILQSKNPIPKLPSFQLERIEKNLPEIYSILTNGKDYDSFKEKISSNLIFAVANNNIATIKKAIAEGADLNKRDKDGNTPLIVASLRENPEIAKILIDGGAKLDIQNNNKDTALMSAAFFCHGETVKALLDAGADKTIRNKSGATVSEFMSAPWNSDMEGLYKFIGGLLQMDLDLEMIEKERPVIAEMLK